MFSFVQLIIRTNFWLVYTIEIMLYLFSFLKKYSLYIVLRKYSLNKAFIALIKTPTEYSIVKRGENVIIEIRFENETRQKLKNKNKLKLMFK